jgi:AcrR family transcriptional regulator
VERIRDAALKNFAAHGTAATSLRDIADTAGVSIGLVQHHFSTKERLITAVDDHVLTLISARLTTSPTASSTDPVGDFGHQVTTLIAEHTDIVDYIVRALIEQTPTGKTIFDALVAMGTDRWNQHREQQLTPPGLDHTWAALNPLILVLGAMTLRTHLDRHLPEPFTTTTQLTRWETAVNALIRHGQLRIQPPPDQHPLPTPLLQNSPPPE